MDQIVQFYRHLGIYDWISTFIIVIIAVAILKRLLF